MNIIKQNLEVMENTDALKHIEKVARTCYKSENMIKDGSALKFVKGLTNIIENGNQTKTNNY